MKLDGLKQVLERFDRHGLPISSLTTDRQKQVRPYICTEKYKINHQLDVWHVAKNNKKSLLSFANKSVLRI